MAGLDFIPGIKEAEARFQENQIEAFAGIEPSICGAIDVLPLTPQMFVELSGAGNAFFGGAARQQKATPVDVAVFLWRVNPGFDPKDKAKRQTFNLCVAALPFDQTILEILEYIRRSWEPMPLWPKAQGGSPSAGVWPSRIVDLFACEYGWSEEYILNLPFRRLWQYANRILERTVKDYNQKSPDALALRDKWLSEQNARQEAPTQAR